MALTSGMITVPLSGHIAPSSSSGSSTNSSSFELSKWGSVASAISTSSPLATGSFFLDWILCGSNVFPSGATNMRVGNLCCAGQKDSGRPSCARVVCEPGAIMRICSSLKGGIFVSVGCTTLEAESRGCELWGYGLPQISRWCRLFCWLTRRFGARCTEKNLVPGGPLVT